MDDFGTGYSSLSHLRQLSISTLKIDRSFVERISEANGTYSIVQAIAALGHSFGLQVVVEGVERAATNWKACVESTATFFRDIFSQRPYPRFAYLHI